MALFMSFHAHFITRIVDFVVIDGLYLRFHAHFLLATMFTENGQTVGGTPFLSLAPKCARVPVQYATTKSEMSVSKPI